jgi:superfamily I DNA/RNA helicase
MKFGGLKFLDAAHIKDVLAVLRWAQNIRDRVAGFAWRSCCQASDRVRPLDCSITWPKAPTRSAP